MRLILIMYDIPLSEDHSRRALSGIINKVMIINAHTLLIMHEIPLSGDHNHHFIDDYERKNIINNINVRDY